jgi:hypothetical protein
MSSDESNEVTRSRKPYERHRREPDSPVPTEQPELPILDPVQWKLVRLGLALVFWGSVAILAVSGLFAAFWMCTLFFGKPDADLMRTLAIGSGCIALAGGLVAVVGQCLCVGVPAVSRARGLIISSVVGTVVTALLIGMAIPQVLAQPSPDAQVDSKTPAAGGEVPKVDVPKVEVPEAEVPKVEVPKVEPPPQAEPKAEPPMADAAPKVATPAPDFPISRITRIWIMAAYFVSQVFFIFFLKKVAIYFHNVFIAESAGGYVTLLAFHTALIALLPRVAMIACFFWVVLIGLEFIILVWFLNLLAGTRKAVG